MTPFFGKIEAARSLAQIVVETVREPLLVLDNKLTILVASSSFHKAFQIDPKDTPDQLLFALDGGAWDIPALHTLLERSLMDQTVVEGFLVEQDFPRIGARVFLLHARADGDRCEVASDHQARAAGKSFLSQHCRQS